MGRRALINLVLAGLVTVLAAGLWLWPGKTPPQPPNPPLVARAPGAIQHIQIEAHGRGLQLMRDKRCGWRLTEPAAACADTARVAAVLDLAAKRAERRFAADTIAAAVTGLDRPALTIRFGRGPRICVGGAGPTPGSRYLRVGADVLLVNAPRLTGLARGWSHWIDPALVARGRRLITLILPSYRLQRQADGGWRITPENTARRAADARATIAAWQNIRALAVVPANVKRAPIGNIELKFAHAGPRRLELIERDPNLILRDPALGVDYHLAGNRVAPLLDLRHPQAIERGEQRGAPVRR